jgi:CheY-like chemotaxis protein
MSKTIVAAVDDMFFASKIRATAEALGVEISFPRTQEALVQRIQDVKPALVIVDLHNQRIDVATLGQALKSDETTAGVKLLGFFSHVETELRQSALAAGFDDVIPRSVFARDLAEILSA